MEKYKSYGTLGKTTHFLSVFCEVGVVQQCTVAQAGVVWDGLTRQQSDEQHCPLIPVYTMFLVSLCHEEMEKARKFCQGGLENFFFFLPQLPKILFCAWPEGFSPTCFSFISDGLDRLSSCLARGPELESCKPLFPAQQQCRSSSSYCKNWEHQKYKCMIPPV